MEIQITNERGDITTDLAEIKKIIREYDKQLYANKLDNLSEMAFFLERHELLELNQEYMENLIRAV